MISLIFYHRDVASKVSTNASRWTRLLFIFAFICAVTITIHAQSGTTGPLTWSISGDTLTISGTGAMPDYYTGMPWDSWITAVVIEDGVTGIGSSAFSECRILASVTIGNSVTSIGDAAFYECTGLTSITIPNSVTGIGDWAFNGCTGLTSITIPNSVTDIGDGAFGNCIGLTSITIPNRVTSIGDVVFVGCIGLTSIIIPNSVTSIGDGAFNGCIGLSSITISNNVTSIGDQTFASCFGLASITIPNSVTSIGDGAFWNCVGLTSLTIPNSVTSIGQFAFSNCTGLTSITIPNSITSIGNSVFGRCTGLTSITIPNSVTNIEGAAFYECTGLTSVTIPNSVTSIGDEAFWNCAGLTSIIIPNSVTSIGDGAFNSCCNLASIYVESENSSYASENGVLFNKTKTTLVCYPAGKSTSYIIPSNVTFIEPLAFCDYSNCGSLTSVTIPNSVTGIGMFAFSCRSLISVTNLNATPQNIDSFMFDGVNLSAATLYVPCGSKAAYESAPFWQDFGTIEEIDCNHHYSAVTSYPNTMTFTSAIVLNGIEFQSDRLEIGAFSGDECRGSVILQNYPEATDHPYLGFLTVHGDAGENITFKVYNHDTGKEYDATNAPVSFVADAINGNPAAPYLITITDTLTQTIPLVEGWSWISVNVASDNPSLLNQFKENIGSAGNMLKGLNEFIQTPGWIGNLSGINNTDMYMVNTNAEQNLQFTGLPVDPATTPVSLLTGWNWIGYTPQGSLPVDEALAGLNPQDGDQIKSYSEYSTYANGQGWVGSLSTMNPGGGYKYYSTNATAQTFVYPSASKPQLKSSNNKESLSLKWTTQANRFANNMTVTSIVLSNNGELQSDQIEIGAFCGNECRGSALLKNFPRITNHPYLGFLAVHGENNDVINLRIYNHATGEEYKADNSLTFVTDAIHGSLAAPFKITASPTGVSNIQSGSVTVYLDPLREKLIIRYPWSSIDRLEIVDLNGRIIWQTINFASESVNVSSLTKGVYILKLVKDNQVSVYKFIK